MNCIRGLRAFCLLSCLHLSLLAAPAATPEAPAGVRWSWLTPIGYLASYWHPGAETLLQWEPVAGAASYTVYELSEPNGVPTAVATGLTDPHWRNPFPAPLPTRYAVAAVNADGAGPVSIDVTVQEAPLEFVSTLQQLPSIHNSYDITATNAWLAWIVDVMSGVDGMVELGTNGIDYTTVYLNTNYNAFHSMMLEDLSPGTLYWYRVTTAGTNRGGWTLTNWFFTDVIPHPPVAYPTTVGGISNAGPVTIQLNATDPDSWGPPLQYYIAVWPTNGWLSAIYGSEPVGPRYVDYHPNPGVRGGDSFAFAVADEQFVSEPALVSIPVIWRNWAPTPLSYFTNGVEDVALALPFSYLDEDGDAATVTLLSVDHGTVTGTAPTFLYTPPPNFSGSVVVLFQVDDGHWDGVVQGFVGIEVAPVNDAPSAQSQSLATAYNTPISFVLAGADLEGSPLSYAVVGAPTGGTLSGTAPNLTFTPTIGWTGTATVSFRVSDGAADSATATVQIAVSAPPSVPSAPTGLTASAVSRTQIQLAWSDPSSTEDGFKIERSTSGGAWSQVGVVGRNVTTYTSSGLSANKVYSYRVRAYNILGNSPYSNTASARTLK